MVRTIVPREDLTFTPEAEEFLRVQDLNEQQGNRAIARLVQSGREAAFWGSDVMDGSSAIERVARGTTITLDMVKAALPYVLDPERSAADFFLANLTRGGRESLEMDDYKAAFCARRTWESNAGRIIGFSSTDVAPYLHGLACAFLHLLKFARHGDEVAREFARTLLEDFGEMPGVNLMGHLKKHMLNAMSNDMDRMILEAAFRYDPNLFKKMYEAFLRGDGERREVLT